ncbi:MAG: HAMP domain-containing sensor histidine kinase [Pseudobdellovibrionaceae bacterium]
MFLKKLSIRTRLTLLFVTIFGSTLILFGILTYNVLASSLQKEFDDALYNYAVDVSESVTLNSSGNLSVSPADVDTNKIYPFSLGTALIQIRSNKGQIHFQSGNFGDLKLPFEKDFKTLSKGEDVVFRTLNRVEGLPEAEAQSYRLISFPLDNSPTPQLILQILVPLAFVEAQINNRKILLEIAIPLVILLSTLAGYFLSSRALKPVQDMVQKARAIEASALSQRLPIPTTKDEVQDLAITLNDLLSRIEQAFQSQERFVADASHQLLTPLTIIKGELEQTLKKPLQPEAVHALDSTLQEVDHLVSLVQNMLMLARVDAGLSAMNIQELFFDEVVIDALSRAEKWARPKNIRLKFDIKAEGEIRPQIRGDEDLLQNMIFNLLENAIKYSKPFSLVEVSLHWTATEQILKVEDAGPGLPENQTETIFERFSRAQKQGHAAPGYGLGLAIARQIAVIHDGELIARNRSDQTGALFQFRIKNI